MKLFKLVSRKQAEALIEVIKENQDELVQAYKTIDKLKKDLDKVKGKTKPASKASKTNTKGTK